MISGKDRRKALIGLARVHDAKGTGPSSSAADPIEAQPLSVAPAEGPGPERKRRRLVRASASTAAAAVAVAATSTEEESSGSPLIHRRRRLPVVEGTSPLQPGGAEVVEVEENSPPLPSAQPAPTLPSPRQMPSSPPAGQSLGQPALPAGGVSALPEGPPPPLPTPAATTDQGEASSRPNASGASHEKFSKVIALVRQLISNREFVDWSGDEVDMHLAKQLVLSLEFSTQHRKQIALEKRVQELEHDKGSLQSDFEAAQGSVALMRGMVEKSRREYLAQVQETIKTEILMGQAVTAKDCEILSLQQANSELAGKLEASEEKVATGKKELEEAKSQLEEAFSSIASLTSAKETAEAEKAAFMGAGAEALADGFEFALEQVQCVLPDLDLSQFSIHNEVEDGKLIPPPS